MTHHLTFESYQGPISSQLASLHPVLQRIYAAREVHSLEQLDYKISNLLHFKTLKNIDAAAALLANSIFEEKRILIVGDFDTDGATSTALAMTALRQFGVKNVNYLIPDRFEYGYGLSPEIVSIARQPDLIMTVDNGISSHEGVIAAKKKGSQVLITDHHLPPEELPLADVIVNPQLPDDQFPSKNLAGVGVTFYVMLALRDFLKKEGWFEIKKIPYPKMDHLLDLVALGTVADMVPMDINNRILVSNGLFKIRSLKARCGIQALFEVGGYSLKNCTASHLGFFIAPKLNAAGRLKDMSLGVACLLEEDQTKALNLAEELNTLNKERQSIEHTMQQKAFLKINHLNLSDHQASICLYDNEWHQGITGLVAGRIKERWKKPAIVFAPTQKLCEMKGSARSVPGIHIRDVLATIAAQYPHILSRFGGHAAAAGLSIHQENYDEFSRLFEETVQEAIQHMTLPHTQYTDGELTNKEMNLNFALLIQEGGPWGQGFEEPLFDGEFQVLSQRIVGQKHLSLVLKKTGLQHSLKAIQFNVDLEKWPNSRANSVRILYRMMVDEWAGRREIKLHVAKLHTTLQE